MGTCHRFEGLSDLSLRPGRVQRSRVRVGSPFAFAGDRSPAKNADQPAHSNACGGGLAVALLLFSCSLAGAANQPLTVDTNLPVLNTAQQVLDLGLEFNRHFPHPVCLRGTVTYAEPGAALIYVQDESAGIRVVYTNTNYRPVSGQVVTVEGTTAAGTFAPFVNRAGVRLEGTAAMPDPCETPATRLAAGELSGQWVQVEGVVRDLAQDQERAELFVSSGGLRFHAVIQPFAGATLPVEWLDAGVILRGVCWTEVDAESKPTGFTLYVPGTNHLFIVQSGKTDPFRQLPLALSSQPELRRQADSRVKVAGVVAFHSPGGHLYLRDAYGPVHARLLVPLARGNPQAQYVERPALPPLRPGERVELVGAPTAATFTPRLQDAEVRRVGISPPPVAIPASPGDIFSGRYDGQLVTLKARLLANENRQAGALKHQVLALQSGDTIFEALWEFAGTNTLPRLLKNSYLQVSGICAVQLGELNQIRSFRLWLREPGDLRVLGRPPWWEPLPVGRILAGTLAFAAAAGVWIWLLRRQVAQRTAQLRGEVAERQRAQTELHHALAAERELNELRSRFVSMVSHEFRTPLGVILSAAENLNDYLDRLPPAQRQRQLQHIMQATRHMGHLVENVLLLGRAEAGKLDCKPAPLDLAGCCERLTHQVRSATAGRCPILFRPGTLAAARGDEGLLRHILTNLLSNAVKYSAAGTPVEFTLEQRNGDAVFAVTDRGIGIPVADQKLLFTAFQRGRNAGHLPGTGLGLVIAKHCVQAHGGTIRCESAEGVGTTFTVRLPLFGER